jgi:hypothetical protein
MTAARLLKSFVVLLAWCVAAGAVSAQGDVDEHDTGALAGLEAAVRVEVLPQALAGPAGARFGPAAAPSEVVDYRVWLGAGRASFGIGLATPVGLQPMLDQGPWQVPGSRSSSMLVGVRYQLSERSRLYVDTASWAIEPDMLERDVRVGFEFKSAPNRALGLARGTLLRVQWNANSHLSLRLRSGGVMIALRSQFY